MTDKIRFKIKPQTPEQVAATMAALKEMGFGVLPDDHPILTGQWEVPLEPPLTASVAHEGNTTPTASAPDVPLILNTGETPTMHPVAREAQKGRLAVLEIQNNSLRKAGLPQQTAQAFAARMGVSALPGAWGNVDTGSDLLKLVKGLRAIKDPEEQVREARQLGLEPLLPLTKISDKQFSKMEGDSKVSSSIFDSQFTQNALEFQSSVGRVSEAFNNLMGALSKPAVQELTNIFNGIADGLNTLAMVVNSPLVKMAFQELGALTLPGWSGTLAAGLGVGAGMDAHTQALKDNTAATQANTEKMPLDGQFGHDARLQGAIPEAFGFHNGFALRQSRAMGEGMKLGAVPI